MIEQNTDHPTQESLLALWNLCKKEINDFGVNGKNDIYRLKDAGYSFEHWVKDICDIVGYASDE